MIVLRNLRRLVAKGAEAKPTQDYLVVYKTTGGHYRLCMDHPGGSVPSEYRYELLRPEAMGPWLDRLISKYGPRWPEQKKEEQRNESENHSPNLSAASSPDQRTTETDDRDSDSDEDPRSSESVGNDPVDGSENTESDGSNDDGEDGTSPSEESCGTSSSSENCGVTDGAQEESSHESGEATHNTSSESGSRGDTPSWDMTGWDGPQTPPQGENSELSNPCEDGLPVTSSGPGSEEEYPSEEGGSESGPDGEPSEGESFTGVVKAPHSDVPIRSFGGDTADDWDIIKSLSRRERRSARSIHRALLKLVKASEQSNTEESPRISGSKLVRELVSRRVNLSRIRREELGLPLILICCDVSGSCSATSNETLAASVALASELPQAVVLRHSNGHLIDAVGQGVPTPPVENLRIEEYAKLFGRPITTVIAFGDWDAGDSYQQFVEDGAQLFWLDSYCACDGPKPASKNLRASSRYWKRPPSGWWQGVNNGKSTAIALRSMARSRS